jgi:hypothetical protein
VPAAQNDALRGMPAINDAVPDFHLYGHCYHDDRDRVGPPSTMEPVNRLNAGLLPPASQLPLGCTLLRPIRRPNPGSGAGSAT